MTDWAQIRAEFPALANWTFLNSATFGQLPRRATEAIACHLARRDRSACSDFIEWFDDADGMRALVARLIHATPDDIAFIPNACTALSLLIGGLDWKPGDQIVTLEDEFPNHYYYPNHLAGRGVQFIETPFERFYETLTERTRLVALSILNYSTGFRPPLADISRFLRDRGILLYVDGTQGVGGLEFDTSEIRPDMLSVDGYKWLLAPNGAGFMYVDAGLREQLGPSVIGWRSDRRWRDFENLHHGAPEFSDTAEKYEGGMLGFAPLYGMKAAIEIMLEIGPRVIEERVLQLADEAKALLTRRGGVVRECSDPSPIVTARFQGKDARAIARDLKERKVLVAARHGNLRVSPHFYNDETDLEKLEQALEAVCG